MSSTVAPPEVLKKRSFPRPDWFLAGMVIAVALAWAFPEPGARNGWMHPELLTKFGISLVFFLHGLGISFAALRAGTLQWRLHLVVQLSTFVMFPLLGMIIFFALQRWMSTDLRLGFAYLCALPSTVSSSVAMTAAARGNVSAALFNATLSSLLGVVITPIWMSLVTETAAVSFSLGEVIRDLCIWLVLPLVVGQVSRTVLGGWASRNKVLINTVDRLTILLMIYTSFCDSIHLGVWTNHGSLTVLMTLLLTAAIFYTMFFLVSLICNRMHLPFADRIAVIFCGSKKSLATGVPMANLMFGQHPGLGLILLPMMVYHPLQLLICGVLAGRWARRDTEIP